MFCDFLQSLTAGISQHIRNTKYYYFNLIHAIVIEVLKRVNHGMSVTSYSAVVDCSCNGPKAPHEQSDDV